ncbi:MAG: IS1595 family transposase [bacterium]|nr:IS1595 family transposase [bacterium]
MKSNKYGLSSLRKQFPTDDACLEFIFNALHTKECSCGGVYKRKEGRRQWQCSQCRNQIAPTAGTIFHKSNTPLTLWFHAVMVFSNAKSGISAKTIQRDLEVTYKTAWRILHLIRKALAQSGKLSGDVEMDTAYFGGRFRSGKNNARQSEAYKAKSVVMGAVERDGNARLSIVSDAKAVTHGAFLKETVEQQGTRLITDKTKVLDNVAFGYDRHTVNHRMHEYLRGDVHVNTIEAFWSHIKRSITGTHKVVSKKYLQEYLDGFVFLRNNRHSDSERFALLLGTLLRASR